MDVSGYNKHKPLPRLLDPFHNDGSIGSACKFFRRTRSEPSIAPYGAVDVNGHMSVDTQQHSIRTCPLKTDGWGPVPHPSAGSERMIVG